MNLESSSREAYTPSHVSNNSVADGHILATQAGLPAPKALTPPQAAALVQVSVKTVLKMAAAARFLLSERVGSGDFLPLLSKSGWPAGSSNIVR
jgi:hypothetical protein